MRLVRRRIRRPEPYGKLELERVIGVTSSNAGGLASNPWTGDIAYLAGAVVVIYNAQNNKQTLFLTAPRAPKALCCVAYSYQGGKFVAAGESGHQPGVLVWDATSGACVADLKSHKYGIACVEFSPNGKHLVSVGVPIDGYLYLWEWRNATVVIRTRTSAVGNPTSALQFSSDGNFFITAGSKHIKHWVVGPHAGRSRTTGAGNLALECRPVKLGSQKEASFVSISCSCPFKDVTGNSVAPGEPQPFYGLTVTGVLCLLHCGLAIEKWVDLKVRHGYGLSVSETHVACACSDGIVRFFMKGTLGYCTTLPRPAPVCYHGLTDSAVCSALAAGHHPSQDVKFPDAVACSFVNAEKLAVIYGDHSLFIWDIQNLSKVEKLWVFLSHSACVWDVATLPILPHQVPHELSHENEAAFATCSTDGSIRLWCLGFGLEEDDPTLRSSLSASERKPTNVYNKEILGVLYSDAKADSKDKSSLAGNEEDAISQGFRSISVSSDGHHLAAGDRSGNLRIYDLSTLQLISLQEAHDSEILTLSFTRSVDGGCTEDQPTASLLASGGRDRLIHVYDAGRDYDVIETLDDHFASITTVKFACNGSKLLSCSADKSVVFRNVAITDSGCRSTRYHQELAPRGTIYDLDINRTDKLAVTVGQDKKVNVLSLGSGKPVRSFKPEGDVGEPIKVKLDMSGTYMVCSHSDKYIRLYDFNTGEVLAQASGHSEVTTGITFLPDCKRLVSVSGDSCIFVWRLPINLSRAIRKRCIDDDELQPQRRLKSFLPRFHSKDGTRAAKMPRRLKQPIVEIYEGEKKEYGHNDSISTAEGSEVKLAAADKKGNGTPAFKFSFSRLPSWAQAKVANETSTSGNVGEQKDETPFQSSESRWTERLGEGYKLFSESGQDLTPPATIRANGFGSRRRLSVDGASVESTPDSHRDSAVCTPLTSPQGPLKKETTWKTVHTVFLNELDFLSEESPGTSGLRHAGQEQVKEVVEEANNDPKDVNCALESTRNDVEFPSSLEQQTTAEDDVVLYLSDTDERRVDAVSSESEVLKGSDDANGGSAESGEPQAQVEADFAAISVGRLPLLEDCIPGGKRSIPFSAGSSLESLKQISDGIEGQQSNLVSKSSPEIESEDEEGGAEDETFVPADDLFSAHFDSLASDVKVPNSARSSFSARFLARAHLSSLRESALSPGGWVSRRNNDGSHQVDGPSTTVSRKAEKTDVPRQQADRDMHHMQQRLVTLGIAVAESIQDCQGPKGVKEDVGTDVDASGHTDNDADVLRSTTPESDEGSAEECELPKLRPIATPPLPTIGAPDSSASSVFSFVKKGKDKHTPKQQMGHGTPTQEPQGASETMEGLSSGQTQDDGVVLDLSEVEPEWISIGDPLPMAPAVQKSPGVVPPAHADGLSTDDCTAQRHDTQANLQADMKALAADLENRVTFRSVQAGNVPAASSSDGAYEMDELNNLSPSEQSNPSMSLMCGRRPRPQEEYKSALQELIEATDKASRFFDELQVLCGDGSLSASKSDVLLAASTYQQLVPQALEKIQRLADQAATYNLTGDDDVDTASKSDFLLPASESLQHHHRSCLGSTLENGCPSLDLRPGVASSLSLSDSALASVDIESFVMRYSTRFSEKLASQVLALVRKELKSNQP